MKVCLPSASSGFEAVLCAPDFCQSTNSGNGDVADIPREKKCKKGDLQGKGMLVHSENMALEGILDASVHSPLAKIIKLRIH